MSDFKMPGTEIEPDPDACCHRCNSVDHLLEGDGPAVCRPCVDLLGAIAADPLKASPRLRDVLADLHAGVVVLLETAGRPGLEWGWIADWPGVEARP